MGICIPGVADASVCQDAPDPTFGMPIREWELSEEYMDGTMLGIASRPTGKIRRVTWYAGGEPDTLPGDEREGWEKRAVFVYDRHQRCTEIQDWLLGRLEFRYSIQDDPDGGPALLFTEVAGGRVTLTVSQFPTDARELVLGAVTTSWYPELSATGQGESRITREYDYDRSGRLLRVRFGGTRTGIEWWYGIDGRIRQVDHPFEKRVSRFEYDSQGRVTRQTASFDEGRTMVESEYRYADGHLVESCSRSNAGEDRIVSFGYGPDGRLAWRTTIEAVSGSQGPAGELRLIEETFDGLDKPLSRRVADSSGRWIQTTTWSYEVDSTGNWFRKTPIHVGVDGEVAVWRVIEYVD